MGEVAPCREEGVGACREGAGAKGEGIMVLLPKYLLPLVSFRRWTSF